MDKSRGNPPIARRLGVRLSASVISLIPDWIMRSLSFLWLKTIATREPREALASLLTVDGYLDRLIDQAALRYGDGIHVKHRLTQYHDFFVGRIRRGERVLDIGCGYGALAYSIATRCDAKVVGIDLDEQHIRDARARFPHPGLEFEVGDATVALPHTGFDVVVMSNVLEHIEQRVEFLRETQRSLSPGRWLFRVPMIDRHWTVPLRQELGLFHFSDETHFIEYTEEGFRRELQAAGMVVTEIRVCWGEIWAEAVQGENGEGSMR
jgi:SAM-dependent methyltransferase